MQYALMHSKGSSQYWRHDLIHYNHFLESVTRTNFVDASKLFVQN